MRFFGKHRDFLASSLWHVCALLCVHSPDKGQAESSQGIWFDLKNAELGADVCVFVCGGVLIRTGPFPMSIHFFSPSYQILANVTTLVAFLRTRKKKSTSACFYTCMFTFCRKGMYTFVSFEWCLAGYALALSEGMRTSCVCVCVNAEMVMWALVC